MVLPECRPSGVLIRRWNVRLWVGSGKAALSSGQALRSAPSGMADALQSAAANPSTLADLNVVP
jgi:hypothetical protein